MHKAFLYLFGNFWRGLLFTTLLFILAYLLNNDNFSIISFLYGVTYTFTQLFSSIIVKIDNHELKKIYVSLLKEYQSKIGLI